MVRLDPYAPVHRIVSNPLVTPYSLLLAVAFQVALIDAAQRLRWRKQALGMLSSLQLCAVAGGIIGAKALWIAEQGYEGAGVFSWGHLRSGYSSMGGIATAVLLCTVFLWKRSLTPLRQIDALTPSLSVGFAVAKVGCLLNGCCFGRPVVSIFSVEYGPGTPAFALVGSQPVLPLQLLISLSACATYLLTVWLYHRGLFIGCLFGAFLVCLGTVRLVAYTAWGIHGESQFLTTPEGTSSIAIVVGMLWIATVKLVDRVHKSRPALA